MATIRITRNWSLLWVPALFTVITLALAWAYLSSVEAHRYATPDDTAFIRPLCYILTALAPLVLLTCFERAEEGSPTRPEVTSGSVVVILAVAGAPIAILVLGFLPAAAIGGFALGFLLSGRSVMPGIIGGGISLLIVLGLFYGILDLDLPLWPGL